MKYEDFLRAKKHSSGDYGFDPVWMPPSVFDFHQERRKRCSSYAHLRVKKIRWRGSNFA